MSLGENRKWLHKPGNGIEKDFLDDWVPILGRFKRIFSPIEVHLTLIFRPPKKEGRDLIHKKYGFSSHRSSKGNFPSSCGMTHDSWLMTWFTQMLSKVKIKKEFRPNSILAICNSKSPRPLVGRDSAKSIRWSLDRNAWIWFAKAYTVYDIPFR